MPIQSRDLLDQIADLKLTLESFSFDNLRVEEARSLKSTFESFRKMLEEQLWKPEGVSRSAPPSIEKKPEDQSSSQEALLIANVSHEIRTPLNGIIGFTDLLKEGDLKPRQMEYVDAIRTASASLLEIINELLEYSKLSAGLDKSANIAFEPIKLINEVGYLCRTLIVEEEVSLELQIASGIPQVCKGDPSKLSQILMNLLGNAIKFVEKGKISLQVDSRKTAAGCDIYFKIEDSGKGIPKDELPFIFDAYHQARQPLASNRKGAGLGLSIVKKLVEQQGGDITVESTPGLGSSFTFHIPYEIGKPEPPKEKEVAKASPKVLEGLCVMVFEDNLLNQKLLETHLKSWGCEVVLTDKVAYGISLLNEKAVDIVLMDLRMPEMDGYEATARIRNHKNLNIGKLPIIAVTADFTVEDNQRFKEAGMDDVILKPYSPDELLSKLKFYSEKRNSPATGEACTPVPGNPQSAKPEEISLERLLEECGGELDILEELLGLFDNNILEFIGQMKLHLKLADFKGILAATHKIKAGLKLLDAKQLLYLVDEMHGWASKGVELDHINNSYGEFIKKYPLIKQQLGRALKQLKNPE